MLFASAANTIIFALEIRKFTDNPAAIATLMTFTGFLTMFTGPLVNWMSDRIWTRIGRRKAFYVPAVLLQAVLILFVPFAPNLGCLAFIYFLQFVAMSCKAPNETLNQEIIPNHQRGRAAVFNKVYVQFGLMSYNLALIGRFDDVFPGTPVHDFFNNVRGEHLIFLVFSLALLSVAMLVGLGIKELRPAKLASMREDLGGRITPWRIVKRLFLDTFSAEWWPLYLLALSQSLYGVSIGGMVALMYTDQWGYSAQVLGFTQGTAQLASIFVVMLVFPIADKFDKLKFYLVTVILGTVGKVIWYGYVMLLVPGNRPSITEILLIGEGINILGQLSGIISYPLVYEFIPLNKLGTASAGLGLFRGLIGMIIGPIMGFWLLHYSNLFMPGAGSHVVIVLKEPARKEEVQLLAKAWEAGTGRRIWVEMKVPSGLRLNESRQWAIRIRDEESEKINAAVQRLESQIRHIQKQLDSFAVRKKPPPPEMIAQKKYIESEILSGKNEMAARTCEFRSYLRQQLAERLVGADAGILHVETGKEEVRIKVHTAFPVNDRDAAAYAEELRLNLGLVRGAVRILVDPLDRSLLTVSAPPVDRIPPENETDLASRMHELTRDAAGPAEAYRNGFNLAFATLRVVSGKGNTLLIPFPEAGYRPHKTDYFSGYILMAIADCFAILIAVYLIRAEKRGIIRRRGKIEDEAAHGHVLQPATAK